MTVDFKLRKDCEIKAHNLAEELRELADKLDDRANISTGSLKNFRTGLTGIEIEFDEYIKFVEGLYIP